MLELPFVYSANNIYIASNLVAILIMLIQLVFGGFLVSKNSFPVVFKWIQDISIFNYANEAFMVNEFVGLKFKFQPQGYDIDLTITGETWYVSYTHRYLFILTITYFLG